MRLTGKLVLFTFILVLITTACKFFFGPNLEWSGFSPVIAIALFSGFIIKQRDFSFLLPLIALFLSDVFIHILYNEGLFPFAGFYSGQWKNYLILLATTLLGWGLKGRSHGSLLTGAVAAPTVFFLISNFQVFLVGHATYSKDFSGLLNCYEAALPFYRNSLVATLIFLPVILLVYNYIRERRLQLKVA